MTSRERVETALEHRAPDRVPIDFGGTTVTGMHVSVVAALRDRLGLEKRLVKVIEPLQTLGLIEDDLKHALGIDTEGILPRKASFGFPLENWKPWRMYDGLEVLVPGDFNTTIDANGDTLLYPQGDLTAPPSGRMPKGGYFFDAIIRQEPFDEAELDPARNTEEFGLYSEEDINYLTAAAERARATGRAVIAKFGSGFGDIAQVPGISLKRPRGIRDVAEWYMSIRTRPAYIRGIFDRQVEIVLENLNRVKDRVAPLVDIVHVCGTDFGTQTSTFCSPQTFRELWLPYYQRVNEWVHAHTNWKAFKHSCGSVVKLMDLFVEAGFDIINPVQVSAAGMEPEGLKARWGDRLVFWGGGVDTQKTLAFGSPREVREQVLRHCEVFARGGGYVFNAVHNVQAQTPVENVLAMFNAVRSFNGQAPIAA